MAVLRSQDRVVWVGGTEERPVGSSGKLRAVATVSDKPYWVNWGRLESGEVDEGWYTADEVVSCKEAGERGIAPWASTQ